MPFLIIFLSIPLIEIALFIMIGDALGIGPTLLLCVASAVAGFFILQEQGFKTSFAARTAFDSGLMPLPALFDGLCLATAGVLFLVPGFFTDFIAFLLLLPAARARLRNHLARRFGPAAPARTGADNGVIDGEYERIDGPEPQP